MKVFHRAIAGGLAAGLSACGSGGHVPDGGAGAPIPVTVASVVAVDAAERLEAGGVVAARESATVSSRILATIASVRVTPGDRVRAGDVLVTLDARDVVARSSEAQASAVAAEKAIAQARAEQRAAESEQALAAAWQTRIAALHARRSATDQERDEANARLSAASARAAGAGAGLDAAEAQLTAVRAAAGAAAATEAFATLRAPFDGLVTERLVDPGNLAAPGLPLLRVESGGDRQVVVRVDEARAAYVHAGDRVRVLLEASAPPGAGAPTVDGVVAEVARAVGADQRAFTVKVTLPGRVTTRSGSFARVVFSGAARRALLIPADALRRHGQVASVYVVTAGVARLRVIQTGPASPDGIEVLAGLDGGESIVTSPLARLADGARVSIAAAPASAGGAS